MFSRFRAPFAFVLVACALGAVGLPAAAVELSPLAQPAPSQIWDEDYIARQGDVLEAALKARLAQKAMADPGATAGMDDYDVVSYDLVLDVDATLQLVVGTTTIAARVTAPVLTTMDLHLSPALTVTGIRSGGLAAGHTRLGDVLTVFLDRPYTQDETVNVEVDYSGNPANGVNDAFYWTTAEGQTMVATLSEPYGARDWWACKDLTTDKADTVSLHVTVDDPLFVASNGDLVSQTPAGPGRTTFSWLTRYPTATYLVSLAIHAYTIINDVYVPTVGDPMPLVHYAVPAYAGDAAAGYAVTAPMIEAFRGGFGEYPFLAEKYGHAHFPWGGGMEHQTCSSMLWWYYGEHLIAHELAHQWWGDLVTCADFHHIWLNEGFARWAEAYWEEQAYGAQAYRDAMNSHRYLGNGTVWVDDTTNTGRIFDLGLTYDKASWVVHMLRFVLGDTDFFAGLQAYRAQYGFGSATTEDLQAVLEAVSGRDLNPFFQQWIYGEYFPQYAMSWVESPVSSQVTVRIYQTQLSAPPFAMPLEIRITTDLETVTHRVDNAETEQWYTLPFNGVLQTVELDPDDWVLCTKSDAGVSGVPPAAATVRITGNTPNPFNPRTEIAFELATAGDARLEIYDAAGRLLRTLVAGPLPAGAQRAFWDGRGDDGRQAAAGVYFARLSAGGATGLHKLMLVK